MTTRRDLERLLDQLREATGDSSLTLDRYQPGDSRTPYRIEDGRGVTPFGERRRSAGELADCMRFALAVAGYDPRASAYAPRLGGPPRGLQRYTVLAEWRATGDAEEIDVDAKSAAAARAFAESELESDYEPGWRIAEVIGPRVGLYL